MLQVARLAEVAANSILKSSYFSLYGDVKIKFTNEILKASLKACFKKTGVKNETKKIKLSY